MTGPTTLDCALQPDQHIDVMTITPVIAALSCLTNRWRDKEPGMGWLALSMAVLALWVAANAAHLCSGPELNPSPWYFVLCLAIGAMGPGLVAYLDLPAMPSWARPCAPCRRWRCCWWLHGPIRWPSAMGRCCRCCWSD